MNIDDAERVRKGLLRNPKRTGVVLLIAFVGIAAVAYIVSFTSEKGKQHASTDKKAEQKTNSIIIPAAPISAGSVFLQGTVQAGNGNQGRGGNAVLKAGDGSNGVSGGNIVVGPGYYKAGDATSGGNGGDLIIKGGDAK